MSPLAAPHHSQLDIIIYARAQRSSQFNELLNGEREKRREVNINLRAGTLLACLLCGFMVARHNYIPTKWQFMSEALVRWRAMRWKLSSRHQFTSQLSRSKRRQFDNRINSTAAAALFE